MSGKQKALLIGLAVVLVVLFVLAVGIGGRRGDGDPADPPDFLSWLGKFGAKQSAVDPATVRSDCAVDGKPTTFTFTGSCTLTVADPGALKTLTLRSSKAFGVQAPAPGGADVQVKDTVSPSPQPSPAPSSASSQAVAKIAVDRTTEIVLTCPGFGTQCTVVATAG
ncbi:MAG: hypothetical protein HOU81_22330 [Hamadaea sp.]|uniref:hypothetical protein n=1 Tax=Hamadaea sp. TaxID=2024425 RepID=UPI0017D65EAB|nr:hypothetical protein [Hamadaea sp.]NUR73566.1 hypothetical protein [Hamadaea sp.]NUT21618.1 hypothetical protein [Hamadaea sp.]